MFECCVNYAADYLVTYTVRVFQHGERQGEAFEVITPAYLLTEVIGR